MGNHDKSTFFQRGGYSLNSLFVRFIAVSLVIWLVDYAPSQAAKRVALVIGNSAYSHAGRLANPLNDAVLIGGKLTNLGFEVLLHTDVKYEEFNDVLRDFQKAIEGAEAAVLFYAGHGIQFKKDNYLLATDADIRDEHDIANSGHKLSNIIELMERSVPLSLAFVDACRDNPMANELANKLGSKSRSLGVGRGLAPSIQYSNSLIAFATKPGAIAADGDGKNSPFSSALAKHMETANIEVSTMLKRVTSDVLAQTSQKQRPEVVASMDSEFYFFRNKAVTPTVGAPETEEQNELLATKALRDAMASNSPIAFKTIMDLYPGTHAFDIAAQLHKQLIKNITDKQVTKSKARQQVSVSAAELLDRLNKAQKQDTTVKSTSLTPEDVENSLGLEIDGYKKVQNALNMLGFDAGNADGVFGGKSRNALKSFQVSKHIEQTGFIDNSSLLSLIKVFEETPKNYDGLWELEVHRINPYLDDPQLINLRTLLSTARLRLRNSELNIVDWQNLAGESRFSKDNPFARFKGSIDKNGKFSIALDADYLFVIKRVKSVKIKGTLPPFVAYDATLKFSGGRLEVIDSKNEIRVRVELRRVKEDT